MRRRCLRAGLCSARGPYITIRLRSMGHPQRGGLWFSVVSCALVDGAVGVEGLAGTFFEKDFVVAEEVVDFVALSDGDEENLAFTVAPGVEEIVRGKEDGWGVGEGAAEEHGGRAAIDEIDLTAEVEGNGGSVGLVPVEEDFALRGDGVAGFELLDGVGEIFGGEHGREASEGDVGGDEEDC